jgi:hypothetical protein
VSFDKDTTAAKEQLAELALAGQYTTDADRQAAHALALTAMRAGYTARKVPRRTAPPPAPSMLYRAPACGTVIDLRDVTTVLPLQKVEIFGGTFFKVLVSAGFEVMFTGCEEDREQFLTAWHTVAHT